MTTITSNGNAIGVGPDPNLQASTNDATGSDPGSADSDPNLEAVRQKIADAIGSNPDGAALMDEVDQATGALPADFSNMNFDQMLAIVMQGANANAVANVQSIGDEINESDGKVGQLTSYSQQLTAIEGNLAPGANATLSGDVLDELDSLGVTVPGGIGRDPNTGVATLTPQQLDALVKNTNTQMQSINDNQGALLQQMTQANNIVNELYDLFAKVTSTVKDTDGFITQHID